MGVLEQKVNYPKEATELDDRPGHPLFWNPWITSRVDDKAL